MLPQPLPHHPPHLLIPKYISQYSNHLLSRPKLTSPYFLDPPHLVSSRVSPVLVDSPHNVEEDAPSPLSGTANYHYVNRASGPYDSPVSPPEMYEDNSHNTAAYPASAHSYSYDINSGETVRAPRSYLSESPSPVDPHSASAFPNTMPAAHSQDRPTHDYQSGDDHFDTPSDPMSDRYSSDTNMHSQNTNLDHRRMSEPAVLGPTNPYASPPCDADPPHRLQQQFNFNPPAINSSRSAGSAYVPSLQRGASMSSLRDARQAHFDYSSHSQYATYEGESHRHQQYHGDDGLDSQISPLQPDFSGSIDSPTGLQYSPTTENHYGPSPPGTGTSTSSAPLMSPTTASSFISHSPRDPNSKTYSFVALPGNTVKKRPRRRYDEIERLYQCSWPDCNKAYGTLNHLNAHVTMQKHGVKRNPNEFKELRKLWRKAKKESDSPVSGPMRRGSLSLRHDGHDAYNSRRYESNNTPSALYTRQPAYNPATVASSSMPVMAPSSSERYSFPVDIGRYPIDDRDDHFALHGTHVRQRYSSTTPASWHASSSRTPGLHQYLSSSLPSQSLSHPDNGNLPHLDTHSSTYHSQPQPHHPPRAQSPTSAAANRLPSNSTLFTPLPGYQPGSVLPPLNLGDRSTYPSDGYDFYEDDNNGRPSTGHGSIDHGSEDEY